MRKSAISKCRGDASLGHLQNVATAILLVRPRSDGPRLLQMLSSFTISPRESPVVTRLSSVRQPTVLIERSLSESRCESFKLFLLVNDAKLSWSYTTLINMRSCMQSDFLKITDGYSSPIKNGIELVKWSGKSFLIFVISLNNNNVMLLPCSIPGCLIATVTDDTCGQIGVTKQKRKKMSEIEIRHSTCDTSI